MGTEIRINEEVSIIIRKHSAGMVEVYRHGVLVWKTLVTHPTQHGVQDDSLTLRRHVTVHLNGTLERINDVDVCPTNLSAGEAGQHA